jgi:hypothetical protein
MGPQLGADNADVPLLCTEQIRHKSACGLFLYRTLQFRNRGCLVSVWLCEDILVIDMLNDAERTRIRDGIPESRPLPDG